MKVLYSKNLSILLLLDFYYLIDQVIDIVV